MSKRSRGIALLLLAALLLSLWLLTGPQRILGVMLLIAVAGLSLHAVSRLPRETLEGAASPAEWKAWINSVFLFIVLFHFLVNFDAFVVSLPWEGRPQSAAGDSQWMLFIAWWLLSSGMASRWKTSVQEDERDREIAVGGVRWGRGALTTCVIGVAAALLLSPLRNLQWATPHVIANLLLVALMCGWLAQYVATGIAYWRDRR